jgi:peptidylprolyl isomerase
MPPKGFTMRLAALVGVLLLTTALSAQQKMIPAPPDVKAPPADAAKTKSGLASKVIKPGTGKANPNRTDHVTVNYTGWTTDGKMFDSSIGDGQPITFPLDRVIAGWTEGLQLMVAGETRRLWIPESLAYRGQRDPRGMLVFDVELISFKAAPAAPAVPSDVKAPPSDAKKTTSGLAYKVQTPGKGTRRPSSRSQVTVHYTGWTTDGKMFDSSVTRGEPATFPLDGVIAGWTEGVQLMVEGEKTRFWIPENLAYKGQQAPFGMLVFDIELLKFQ